MVPSGPAGRQARPFSLRWSAQRQDGAPVPWVRHCLRQSLSSFITSGTNSSDCWPAMSCCWLIQVPGAGTRVR